MQSHTTRTSCRVCRSKNLTPLFSLGEQYVSNFPAPGEDPGLKCPIELELCEYCTAVQARHTAPQEFLYSRQYWYRSGVTQIMRDALQNVAHDIEALVDIQPDDVVLDIGCFPEADVITPGYIPVDISKIQVGDNVLDREGDFVRVKKCFKKHFNGELVVLKLRGMGPKTIRTTPNHPILRVKGQKRTLSKEAFSDFFESQEQEWVRADQLEAGDYCVMPKVFESGDESKLELDLTDLLDCDYDEDFIYSWQGNSSGVGRHRSPNETPLPRYLKLDSQFGRLLGYYVAEGAGEGRLGAFTFTFHQKEKTYIKDVMSLLRDYLGLESTLRPCPEGKGVSIRCNSALGKRVFQSLVGSGAANKQLPDWTPNASSEFRSGVLDGMVRGDGTTLKEYVGFNTVSKTLAYQIRYLLFEFGVNSCVALGKPRGYGEKNGKISWHVRVFSKCARRQMALVAPDSCSYDSDDGGMENNKWPTNQGSTLVRIAKIDREVFNGEVYNLETETGSYVVDSTIVHNSNDGTLLRSYSVPCRKVAVEPADNMVRFYDDQDIDLIHDFWTYQAFRKNVPDKQAKVITALGMFYDLEDPNQFIEDVRKALAPDGIFVAQLMCLRNMLDVNDVGNLAHEHLLFYSLQSLRYLFGLHGLEIIDVQKNSVNGQSYRIYARHCGSGARAFSGADSRIFQYEALEEELSNPAYYKRFFAEMEANKLAVHRLVKDVVSNGKRVWVYGASTKGNVLLQYYGLDNTLIEGAVDRSPEKWGKVTVGTNIPIYSNEDGRAANPDFFLVLPYAFIEEFLQLEKDWHDRGGRFIVPLPRCKVL